MRKSIAAASLGGRHEGKLVAAAPVGFDGVELSALLHGCARLAERAVPLAAQYRQLLRGGVIA